MAEPMEPFTVTLGGVEDKVRGGIAGVIASLAPLSLSADDTATVELVLAEALNNVVEHALARTNALTEIMVRGAYTEGELTLTVIDTGVAMPAGRAPRGKAPDLDVATDELPEGGFGWFMIHSLTEQVSYARIGDANHLTLRVALPSGTAP